MHLHDLFVSIIAFVSELLGTLSGFGSSTFFIPLGVLFEKYNFILALTALLHVFGNLSKLFLFRKDFNKKIMLQLALPSIIFSGIGALLNHFISFDKLKFFLGIFIIILSVVFFFKKKIIRKMSVLNARMTIAASGFLTGLLGTGGALRGIALSGLQLEKNTFVALSSGIDLGGDLLRGSIYIYNNYFDWSQWYYIPVLLVTAYLGSSLGKKILSYIKQDQFEKIVLIFVFISGLLLIVNPDIA